MEKESFATLSSYDKNYSSFYIKISTLIYWMYINSCRRNGRNCQSLCYILKYRSLMRDIKIENPCKIHFRLFTKSGSYPHGICGNYHQSSGSPMPSAETGRTRRVPFSALCISRPNCDIKISGGRVQGGAGGGCGPSYQLTWNNIPNNIHQSCQTNTLHHTAIKHSQLEPQ